MTLFDMHTHILPGVDDGSVNMNMSLEMLHIAYDEGVRNIVLTPHYILGNNSYTYDELSERFDKLIEEKNKDKELAEINLYLGNEILYEEGIVTKLKEGDIHTMNGTKYILIEYNTQIPYSEIVHSIDEITQARYWPILAHVERYRTLFGNIGRIEELVSKGCFLQMNVDSVSGSFLDEMRNWCRKLVKSGYITFFATDAHNVDSRAPYCQEHIKWIEKKCEDASFMLEEAAQMMIDGKYID